MLKPLFDTERLMAEMMPLVIVPAYCSPSGLPMATMPSPTWQEAESANAAQGKFSPSIFRTARSVAVSLPTKRALRLSPSGKITSAASEPSSTWALVTT